MEQVILYMHGKGGSPEEAIHYRPFFSGRQVIGLDYTAQSPQEAKEEFPILFNAACRGCQSVEVVANSIGAYFTMSSLTDKRIKKAYFISPIVDMEKLISDMMAWAHVTEAELRSKKEISTDFGETLSWEYLCYVREHPIVWNVPTHILYGEKDHLTSYEAISTFAEKIHAALTVMPNGEHWFHTEEQMKYLDNWITSGI